LRFRGRLRDWASSINCSLCAAWCIANCLSADLNEQVLRYLGAYTHRVAISNRRLVGFEDDEVGLSSQQQETSPDFNESRADQNQLEVRS
jgi:Putative transposase